MDAYNGQLKAAVRHDSEVVVVEFDMKLPEADQWAVLQETKRAMMQRAKAIEAVKRRLLS